jgi:hypothetical protein
MAKKCLQSIARNLSRIDRNKLDTYGYVVIDDFLPQQLYKKLLKDLKSSESEINYQVRSSHYSHILSSDNPNLPREEETYIAKFSLIKNKQDIGSLKTAFFEHLAPIMKEATDGIAKFSLHPTAVRIRGGDVYRAHQDSYAGIIGYSFFLNEGWCWDYGGILTYVRDNDCAEPIFPKANRLLLRNEKFKHFHFLNTVEQYCNKEQYIVLGWAGSSPGETASTLGDYFEF